LAEEALNKQVGDQTAQLRQAGFTQAQQQFERDRAARQFDIQKGLDADALSQRGITTAADVARGITETSRQGFGMTMDQINALNQRANMNRQIEQGVLNYPMTGLSNLLSILRGYPAGTDYQETTTEKRQDQAKNSVLGTLLGIASVAAPFFMGPAGAAVGGLTSLGIDPGSGGNIGEFGGSLG
jgi:hypothetical protein